MSRNIHLLLALAGLLALPSLVSAQADLPRIDLGRGGVIRLSSSSFGGGTSYQKTVRDGVTTIKATEKDGKKVTIVDDPDNGITVKITKRYSPENADELEKSMPGLYMHLKSIPKTSDNAKVEVHVDVTRDFEADDKEDLKNKHPEIFKVYDKYSKGGAGRMGLGGVRGMRMIRPMEIRPLEMEMKIEDMRKEVEKKMEELRKRIPEVGGGFERLDREKKEDKKESKDKKSEKKKDRNDT